MIGVDHGRERRTRSPVATKHVLDDFLAPFVLEVDVDIRRLVTLAGEKALEQQPAVRRVQLGDAQGETDTRVGRRTPALAEDVLLAGKTDDVVHGQKVAFVFQFGDQRQLVFELRAGPVRHSLGPTLSSAALHQNAQPGRGVMTFWHQLVRVVILQLLETEVTALGDAQALCEQLGRIQLGQLLNSAQMPFAIGKQIGAGLSHGQMMTDGGHAILQGAAATGVHVYVATGHGRQVVITCQLEQALQARGIVRATMQRNA